MGLWLHGFTEWHNKYFREIAWFFIGFFFVSLLTDLRTGSYVWALIDVVLIVTNYLSWKRDANQ